MFIKRGGDEGKIVSVVDGEELTEEQKKVAKNLSKQNDQAVLEKSGDDSCSSN